MSNPSVCWPRVSLVTPSYNAAAYLRAAIDSVLAQDYPDIDYLVMDGGSQDGTVELLASYGERVRWVSEKDGGQSDAIARGFEQTSGEILGWLNADDLLKPGAVRAAVEALQANPQAALVYGQADFIDAEGQHLAPCTVIEPYSRQRLLHYGDYIVQPATFFTRRAYAAVGGLDKSLNWAMDWDLWLRLAREHGVVYLEKELASYRWLGSNKTAEGGFARLDEVEMVARRHGCMGLPAYFRLEKARQYTLQAHQRWQHGKWGGDDKVPRAGCRVNPGFAQGDEQSVQPAHLAQLSHRSDPLSTHRRTTSEALMNETPDISIVMPSYQQRHFLEEAVRSVLDQQEVVVELLVMDPGSTDGSRELLQRLHDHYGARLQLHFAPDEGQADAINHGMALARGRILGWLNSDDRLRPGALRQVLAHLQGPGPRWLYGRGGIIDEDNRPISLYIVWYKNFRGRRFSRDKLLTEDFIPQMATFWNRPLWEAVGGLDKERHLAMDYDLFLRFAKITEPLVLPEYLADFRVHGAAKSSLRIDEHLAEAYATAREHAVDLGWRGKPTLLLHRIYAERTRLIYRWIKP